MRPPSGVAVTMKVEPSWLYQVPVIPASAAGGRAVDSLAVSAYAPAVTEAKVRETAMAATTILCL